MTIPTAAVPAQGWNSKREALLVKEKQPTGSWTRRHDEYGPKELAGGRTGA